MRDAVRVSVFTQISSRFVEVSRRLPANLVDPVQQMLHLDPEHRPSARLFTLVRERERENFIHLSKYTIPVS